MKNTLSRKIIFIFCGAGNAIFGAISFYFIFPLLEPFLINNMIIGIHFIIVMAFNFFNYNYFIYKIKSSLFIRFFKFLLSNAILLPLVMFLFNFMYSAKKINYFFSYLFIVCTIALITYFLNDLIVFKKDRE